MTQLTILERWKLSEQELTIIVDENPSLRGMMLGYIGEYKLRSLLMANPHVTSLQKPDDHDRSAKSKNDLTIVYKNRSFTIEVKSLQTNSIKRNTDGTMMGVVQVDASDKRPVTFPDGTKLQTTCLLRGQFDILAVNLFQFRNEWDFGFILNQDLPSSKHKDYTPEQQKYLLATSIKVTYPLQAPYHLNPFDLFDQMIEEMPA